MIVMNNEIMKYKKYKIMKKFSFLISVTCFVGASLLTSCFSSGGEMPGTNIRYKQYEAKFLNPDGVNAVHAECSVDGLKGYAIVDEKTSQDLVNEQHIAGLLIVLETYKDENLKTLKTPEDVINPSYQFPTTSTMIKAECRPKEAKFITPLDLTVCGVDDDVDFDGMEFEFYYKGVGKESDDVREVEAKSDGLHTTIPYFGLSGRWMFRMNFDIRYVEQRVATSDELTAKCARTNTSDLQKAEYKAPRGFKTDTNNPFVVEYLKQWIGEQTEATYAHYYSCSVKPGTEVFHYEQTIYTLCLTSGSKSFYFDVYGTPVAKHDNFISVDHNGGSGVNP